MPLIKGYSARSIGKNIGAEMKAHPKQSQAQNVAIALSVAREAARAAHKPAIVKKYTQKKKKWQDPYPLADQELNETESGQNRQDPRSNTQDLV